MRVRRAVLADCSARARYLHIFPLCFLVFSFFFFLPISSFCRHLILGPTSDPVNKKNITLNVSTHVWSTK